MPLICNPQEISPVVQTNRFLENRLTFGTTKCCLDDHPERPPDFAAPVKRESEWERTPESSVGWSSENTRRLC